MFMAGGSLEERFAVGKAAEMEVSPPAFVISQSQGMVVVAANVTVNGTITNRKPVYENQYMNMLPSQRGGFRFPGLY